MLNHRAHGRDLEQLAVTVVDDRRPMLAAMRAMLAAIGVGRIEAFDDPIEALAAMRADTPDIVLAAQTMRPLSGSVLVRTMRRVDREPLCFVPAVILGSHSEPSLIEEALMAGAHQVLMLPTSASTLYRRLDWLLNDDRPFQLMDYHYVVAGFEERLLLSRHRPTYVPSESIGSLAAAMPDDAAALVEELAVEAPLARAARG